MGNVSSMIDYLSMGKRIWSNRRGADFTQEALAEKANVMSPYSRPYQDRFGNSRFADPCGRLQGRLI